MVPTHIFLIPYRNRGDELNLFIKNIPPVLEEDGITDYKIIIIEQADEKLFNRGMMLNIGFLEVKKRYPKDWKYIQLVCHDIDIYPTKSGIINYNTIMGYIRHPYGVLRPQFKGTVGGICIIMGEDYFRSGGHPNLYGWGGEDVGMSRRCQARGIQVDETNFINRRSTPFIVDPDSHPTVKDVKFAQICDSRNLKKVFTENPENPSDTISNIIYHLKTEKIINDNTIILSAVGSLIF